MKNTAEISKTELDERVAILRRFRTLLEQQKSKFQEYLKVLECQETSINSENADAIIAHSELETQIMAGIGNLQKVIEPMQKLYQSTEAAKYSPQDAVPISKVQDDLAKLQAQVLEQNQKNRDLLKNHMAQLKQQINNFQNPYKYRKSAYVAQENMGNRIQIVL